MRHKQNEQVEFALVPTSLAQKHSADCRMSQGTADRRHWKFLASLFELLLALVGKVLSPAKLSEVVAAVKHKKSGKRHRVVRMVIRLAFHLL